jgi:hypothetical protein
MNCSPPTLLSLVLGLGATIATLAQCNDAASQDKVPQGPPPDQIRILVSGAMLGHLEPCGCASGQLGGLARRMQHIGEKRNYDLLLEGGNLIDTATELDLLKLITTNTVLFGMEHRYDALGVGDHDLAMAPEEWGAVLALSPVVASNLTSSEPGWPGKPFVEKDVRGVKVRVASFLLALPPALRTPEAKIKLLPTDKAWQGALAGSSADTRRIVMVHGADTEIRALIPQLTPKPDLVIGIDNGYLEPTSAATPVGGVPLVFAGIRGRVLLEVQLHRDATGSRAICQLVPLPGSKTMPGGGGDPNVRDEILRHRHDVKGADVLTKMAQQLPTANGAAYVGSEMCKTCHPTAYASYEKTRHAGAWETLEKAEKDPTRYGWPVTAYPDCVGCHVVGWREQTGFLSAAETPQLTDVGCERCHGAGSDHMASPGTKPYGIIGGAVPSMLCIQCHDFEQSPNFVYGERWPLIQHGREPSQVKKK